MTDKLPPKVCVVEQDTVARAALCNTIERYWFDVTRAPDADAALRLMQLDRPHVMVIGTKIGKKSAVDLYATVTKSTWGQKVPCVFIIDEQDNAEEYNKLFQSETIEIVKYDYSSSDIMMAIKTLFRRCPQTLQDKNLTYKDLTMDLSTYKVMRAGREVRLGPTEFKILQLFVQYPNKIFSRQQIVDYVWGVEKEVEVRTVDVHVNRLRSFLKNSKEEMPMVKTVRAAGYCLNLPGEVDTNQPLPRNVRAPENI